MWARRMDRGRRPENAERAFGSGNGGKRCARLRFVTPVGGPRWDWARVGELELEV